MQILYKSCVCEHVPNKIYYIYYHYTYYKGKETQPQNKQYKHECNRFSFYVTILANLGFLLGTGSAALRTRRPLLSFRYAMRLSSSSGVRNLQQAN